MVTDAFSVLDYDINVITRGTISKIYMYIGISLSVLPYVLVSRDLTPPLFIYVDHSNTHLI